MGYQITNALKHRAYLVALAMGGESSQDNGTPEEMLHAYRAETQAALDVDFDTACMLAGILESEAYEAFIQSDGFRLERRQQP